MWGPAYRRAGPHTPGGGPRCQGSPVCDLGETLTSIFGLGWGNAMASVHVVASKIVNLQHGRVFTHHPVVLSFPMSPEIEMALQARELFLDTGGAHLGEGEREVERARLIEEVRQALMRRLSDLGVMSIWWQIKDVARSLSAAMDLRMGHMPRRKETEQTFSIAFARLKLRPQFDPQTLAELEASGEPPWGALRGGYHRPEEGDVDAIVMEATRENIRDVVVGMARQGYGLVLIADWYLDVTDTEVRVLGDAGRLLDRDFRSSPRNIFCEEARRAADLELGVRELVSRGVEFTSAPPRRGRIGKGGQVMVTA